VSFEQRKVCVRARARTWCCVDWACKLVFRQNPEHQALGGCPITYPGKTQVERAAALRALLMNNGSGGSPSQPVCSTKNTASQVPPGGVTYEELQQQLLADVDATRKRQRAAFVDAQLRRGVTASVALAAAPGHAVLLHHVVTNTLGHDAVFQLRLSAAPSELRAIEDEQEHAAIAHALGHNPASRKAPASLQAAYAAANAAVCSFASSDATGAPLLPVLFPRHGRVFLAAGECSTLALLYRAPLPSTQAHSQQGCLQYWGVQPATPAPMQTAQTCTVELVPLGGVRPSHLLELQV
jgi:hypothetical protein